ncbi:MAG: energy-coupling factor transporter ATPase, partial [Clostridia bacterium]|nr:energy-coupling factor transporter ATPase [Clostridia bacterium]
MIEVKNLTFRYGEEGAEALREIDLTFEKGVFTAVLGRNGSGKSTLAKHLNAILLPSGGSVFVDGIDTRDEKRLLDVRKKVGMVFQNPDNQLVASSVEEDVAFGLENMGVPHEEMEQRIEAALKAVGMYERRKSAAHLLSGGQKQRVAIAGVIAMEPETVVFDEPTAMLDPRGRREVMETIKMMRQRLGMTVILITHSMDEAAKADRIVVIDSGRIAMDGEPREIFSRVDELKDLGLDVPQV